MSAYPPNSSSPALKQRTAWDNNLAADKSDTKAASGSRPQAWESAPMPPPPVPKVASATETKAEEVDDEADGLDVISYWAMSAAGWWVSWQLGGKRFSRRG